ncbi:MAG: hypothetical protein COA78_08840 [Blastopirellula sp.]|nr:MAG: hypothetical protein COA78_08840 [Blastopirellula sp.]
MDLPIFRLILLGMLSGAAFLVVVYRKSLLGKTFSLRSLMLLMAVIAACTAYFTSWQYMDRANTVWIAVNSAEAKSLITPPTSIPHPNQHSFMYFANYQSIQKIFAQAESKIKPTNFEASMDNDRLIFTCEDPIVLMNMQQMVEQLDQPSAGEFIIRGIIKTRENKRMGDVAIDLMGPYSVINVYKTRPDGSFSIPVAAKPGHGYYLRIRDNQNQRTLTRPFSLIAGQPELVVKIQLK